MQHNLTSVSNSEPAIICFVVLCFQVVALTDVYIGPRKWGIKLRLPALNDAKLLLAALVWPPSCFVSDATAKTGAVATNACFQFHFCIDPLHARWPDRGVAACMVCHTFLHGTCWSWKAATAAIC